MAKKTKVSKEIVMSAELTQAIRRQAQMIGEEISPPRFEMAEMVLDRISGAPSKEIDKLIAAHGVDAVLAATAKAV